MYELPKDASETPDRRGGRGVDAADGSLRYPGHAQPQRRGHLSQPGVLDYPPLEIAPEQSQKVRADGDTRPRPSPAATSSSRPAPSPAVRNAPADQPTTNASPAPGPSPTSPQRSSSGCSTETAEVVVVGFGRGDPCSYSATKPGGYFGQGVWWISVKRGDTTIEVDYSKDPSCSQTGFIHPGDEVTARVEKNGFNRISVGDDAHC